MNTPHDCGGNYIIQCRYGCGSQYVPDTLINVPSFDFIHEVHMMKQSTLMVYSLDKELGFFTGGNFSFGSSGYNTNQTKAFDFSFGYVIPFEKKFPVFDLPSIRIVYSENNFLSFSIDNMDMIMVSKTDFSVNLARPTVDMFAAFSFYNTHDFTIDGMVYYFGGIVNNTVSNRIAVKTSIETIQIFNQTLPYAVASGMLSIVDEYLYIFGGLIEEGGTLIPTYRVMRCLLSNVLVWEEVPKVLPTAIYNGIVQVVGEYIYLFGGRVGGSSTLNSDILYAQASDLIWQNSYRTLPYPYTESNLFSDDSYLYLIGGFGPTFTELTGISRASKTNPLVWEDIGQRLPIPTMGITSTLILNNTLHLFSVDLPQNFQKPNPNVPVSIHTIYFANETKPYVIVSGISVSLQVLDDAYTLGSVQKSCREYRDLIPTAKTGVYWIKPLDSMAKFKVYCDMSYLGGGWTLVSARSASNPVLVPSTDYVRPDYSGNTFSDDKWSALRSVSTDIVWKDSTDYFAIASITTLSTPSNFVCKTLSTSLLDAELFRMEDNKRCSNGTDTCTLGANGNSASITSYCGKINVFNPFKVYTFPVENYGGTKANMYIR